MVDIYMTLPNQNMTSIYFLLDADNVSDIIGMSEVVPQGVPSHCPPTSPNL